MNSLVNERETMKYYRNEFNEAGTKISMPSALRIYIYIQNTFSFTARAIFFSFSSFGKDDVKSGVSSRVSHAS